MKTGTRTHLTKTKTNSSWRASWSLAPALLFLASCVSQPLPSQKSAQANATYYIDCKSGQDRSDGTTETTAWKSFANLKNVWSSPGFSNGEVRLRRGCRWRETLRISALPEGALPVSILAYGQGDSPVIDGAREIPQNSWSRVGPEVWSAPLASDEREPLKLYLDGKESDHALLRETVAELKEAGQWAWVPNDGGRIFLRLAHSPARHRIEASVLRYGIHVEAEARVWLQGVKVSRARDGFRLDGNGSKLHQVVATENSHNGIHLVGQFNEVVDSKSEQNGVRVKPGKSGRTGHGVLIDGANNKVMDSVLSRNEEDGVQFGPEAGSGNELVRLKMSANGEN